MTAGFLILCAASVAVISFVISGLSGAMVLVGERELARLATRAQSRILFAVVLTPALASFAVFFGAWGVDVYVLGCDAHGCRLHAAGTPSWATLSLATLFLGRVGMAVWRSIVGSWRSRSIRRALDSVASQTRTGLRVLPVEDPYAFVVGMLRPEIFISQGLLRACGEGDLEAILAHERSHVLRRDPLRRWFASLALAFHLPFVASALERRLARSQELAADANAAHTIGDAPRFAEALLRLARLRLGRVPLGVAFFGSDLEARIRNLLISQPRPDQPRPVLLLGAGIALLVLALWSAHSTHHGTETLLRFLSG